MKRIIRLTESDLTRIIKRVISEKTETTTMTPESHTVINGIGGHELEVKDESGKNLNFIITPNAAKTKNNKGEMVVTPGVLYIHIKLESKPQTYAYFNYDCNSGTFSDANGFIGDDYGGLNIYGNGGDSRGNASKGEQILKKTLYFYGGGGKYIKKGPVSSIIDKYCSAVIK